MKIPLELDDQYVKEVIFNRSLKNLLREKWKLVEGFESYAISNYGRVKSLEREVVYSDGRRQKLPERIMTLQAAKQFNKYLNTYFYNIRFAPLKKAVLTGKFYEFLIPLFTDIKPDYDGMFKKKFYDSNSGKAEVYEFPTKRDLMEKLTLQILYTPLKRPSQEYKVFKQHFPLLCECIEIFKTTSNDKDSFKLFPKLLQQVESDCVIDTIIKQIAETNPDMTLWAIHDSFCTMQSWFPVLESMVQELFLSYSQSVLPSFKTELWCNDDECLKVA